MSSLRWVSLLRLCYKCSRIASQPMMATETPRSTGPKYYLNPSFRRASTIPTTKTKWPLRVPSTMGEPVPTPTPRRQWTEPKSGPGGCSERHEDE